MSLNQPKRQPLQKTFKSLLSIVQSSLWVPCDVDSRVYYTDDQRHRANSHALLPSTSPIRTRMYSVGLGEGNVA